MVEDHHVIPKEFRNHIIIKKYKYNISSSNNIMMMPNKKGIELLNTNRLLHSGGHLKYNKYVKNELNKINNEEELYQLLNYLKSQMNGNSENIPWK